MKINYFGCFEIIVINVLQSPRVCIHDSINRQLRIINKTKNTNHFSLEIICKPCMIKVPLSSNFLSILLL